MIVTSLPLYRMFREPSTFSLGKPMKRIDFVVSSMDRVYLPGSRCSIARAISRSAAVGFRFIDFIGEKRSAMWNVPLCGTVLDREERVSAFWYLG
jgi:hypothetical protein